MKPLRILVGLLVIAGTAALIWSQTTPFLTTPLPSLPVKPVSGAAVFYNQAFAAMPELSESEKKLFVYKANQPLDTEESRKLVAKFGPSLKLLEQGAKVPQCEWGLDLNLGAEIPMSYLTKWLHLAKVLRLKARLELDDGNILQATDDLLMGFHVGRQVDKPPLFIMSLVRASTDYILLDLVLRNLPRFDALSIKRLSDGINALPTVHSLRETIEMEKKTFFPYLRRVLSKTARSKMAEDSMVAKMMTCSPRIWLLMVDDMERLYNKLEPLCALPYVQAQPKIEELEGQINREWFINRLSVIALPNVLSVRAKTTQSEIEWTIFQTALNAQLHNPASVRAELAKLRDPFDDQPIEMRDVEGGVEIQLKSGEGKKPVTLTVGLSGK